LNRFEDTHILALDTVGEAGSIAVLKGMECLLELSWQNGTPHSRNLLPIIRSGLGVLGLKLQDMGLIVVNRGPGRWTGIRLGIATAMGLSMALDIPVAGVAGLDAMAQWAALSACRSGDVILPVLNARRSQVYTACYEVEACNTAGFRRRAVRYSDYSVVQPHELLNSLKTSKELLQASANLRQRRIVLCGDGAEAVLPVLKARFSSSNVLVCAPPAFLPGAAAMGYTALQEYGLSGMMPKGCNPLYIRPSDAEANKSNTKTKGFNKE
jgi:tRNA threonylcarbamoyl adenosine modification protein YeaZ